MVHLEDNSLVQRPLDPTNPPDERSPDIGGRTTSPSGPRARESEEVTRAPLSVLRARDRSILLNNVVVADLQFELRTLPTAVGT
jgi:hypothetical protein